MYVEDGCKITNTPGLCTWCTVYYLSNDTASVLGDVGVLGKRGGGHKVQTITAVCWSDHRVRNTKKA